MIKMDKEVARVVATVVAKDKKAARSLAAQYLASTDKVAMANFLLAGGVAEELLTARLMKSPAKVMRKLDGLTGPSLSPDSVWESPPGRVTVARSTKSSTKRHRATAEESTAAKDTIVAFVKKHPGSTRKAIQGAVQFSMAFYNRIMRELKTERRLKQKGQRSKATYYVK